MGHYKSNVRDLEFNLFEVLRIQEVLETGAYGDLEVVGALGARSFVGHPIVVGGRADDPGLATLHEISPSAPLIVADGSGAVVDRVDS